MPKSQGETIVWVGTWGVTLDSLFISFIHSIFGSVQFSYSVVSNSSQPHGEQHARHPCPSPTPQACSNSCPSSQSVMPSNHLILCHPLLLLPSIFASIRVFSNEKTLSHQVAKILELQPQHQSFQ